MDGRRTSARPIATRCIWPPGEPGRRVPQLVVDPQQARDLRDARADVGLGDAPHGRAQREGEVVVDGEVRVERVLLEHEGDVAPGRFRLRPVDPADADGARIGALEACREPQGRRLAGSRGSEQHHELSVRIVNDRSATASISLKRFERRTSSTLAMRQASLGESGADGPAGGLVEDRELVGLNARPTVSPR